jgi:hypothetical protein
VPQLEDRIAEWRAFVAAAPAVDARDLDELEAHLRDQIADLDAAGLSEDEAFLVAVGRLGSVDVLSGAYAREHSERLWRQLTLGSASATRTDTGWRDALTLAVAAAVAVLAVRVVAGFGADEPWWVVRNLGVFVLPFVAALFVRRRQLSRRRTVVTAGLFAAAAVFVNVLPFAPGGATELVVAAHLPVLLWCVVAYAYMAGEVSSYDRRMDVVRFTGEWAIYYALFALGGGVLLALTVAILAPVGLGDPERAIEWLLPSAAAGAVVVAAWLVEVKQRVVENMAPVLTMVFTPLFALMLVVATIAYAVGGVTAAFDRELVAVLDALLVVVLGLVLFGLSARAPDAAPGWLDRVQLVAIVAALLLDVLVLSTMVGRVGELGLTPNRVAALGLNLVLLVNLAGAAWCSLRFLLGRGTLYRLVRWQLGYLPVFVGWLLVVVVVVPFAFRFA